MLPPYELVLVQLLGRKASLFSEFIWQLPHCIEFMILGIPNCNIAFGEPSNFQL